MQIKRKVLTNVAAKSGRWAVGVAQGGGGVATIIEWHSERHIITYNYLSKCNQFKSFADGATELKR